MNRRLILFFLVVLVVGLVALIPLRSAVAPLVDQGFTARQVAGTIWYGRIGELTFGTRRLGTFEVAFDPLALLTGAVKMKFQRLGDPHGVLDGTLVSGGRRGLGETTGRIGVAGLFGALPIDAIEFDKVTLLFRGQECASASGAVTMVLAAPIPGVDGVTLRGSLRCENRRVRFTLATPSGAGRIDFYVRSGGDYRAWLHVRAVPPDQAALLGAAGFTPSSDGLTMSAAGKL